MAASVAGVIEPTLQAAETARSADRPTSDLTAYDLYLRAYAMFFASAREIPEALRLLEQAFERDPRYGPALAWAAVCCLRIWLDRSSADPTTDRRKSADYAQRALQAAGDDPGVLANAALALKVQGDPSFPMPWRYLAICYVRMGRLEEAREVAARLRAITPVVVANEYIFAAPRIANSIYPACAWRPARAISQTCRQRGHYFCPAPRLLFPCRSEIG